MKSLPLTPKDQMKRPPLRQGADPAQALYREQVRRDVEAAHKWLQQQKVKS